MVNLPVSASSLVKTRFFLCENIIIAVIHEIPSLLLYKNHVIIFLFRCQITVISKQKKI